MERPMRTVLTSQGEFHGTEYECVWRLAVNLKDVNSTWFLPFHTEVCTEAVLAPDGALAPHKDSFQSSGLQVTVSAPSLGNPG